MVWGGTYTEIVGTKINVGIQYIQNEGNVHNSKMRQQANKSMRRLSQIFTMKERTLRREWFLLPY
jgi:hypothetical protein